MGFVRPGGRRIFGEASRRVTLWILLVLFVASASDAEAPVKATEYELKAAFLFNFARFTEWPPTAGRSSAIVFGVLGDDPFGAVLDDTIRGKAVGGRPLTVRRLRQAKDSAGCDLLFVASSEKARVPRLLREVSGPGLLTVGETERFAELGGVIELVAESGRIRLVINTDAADRAGVRISSKLLAMARIVGDGKGTDR